MIIRSIRHKGLRRLIEDDDASSLQSATVDKLVRMLSFLQDMQSVEELRAVTVWKAHLLSGDRRGVWSLHVTRNWRLTFRIDGQEIELLDLEDYH